MLYFQCVRSVFCFLAAQIRSRESAGHLAGIARLTRCLRLFHRRAELRPKRFLWSSRREVTVFVLASLEMNPVAHNCFEADFSVLIYLFILGLEFFW